MLSFLQYCVLKARSIFKSKPKVNSRANLTADLTATERVNPSPHLGGQSVQGLEVVYRLTGPERTGDGLWKCCMGGHEQELIHWTGTHPFKHLKCLQCDHVLCRWCATTSVLTLLPHDMPHPKIVFTLRDQTVYGQICPDCGMSHLARPVTSRQHILNDRIVSFKGTKCLCGFISDHTWLQFKVGSIDDYRQNPNEAWALLTAQRAELSVLSRRTSAERHALRSKRSSIGLPASRTDSCTQAATPHSSISDGSKSNVIEASDGAAARAWSLRVHEVNEGQESDVWTPFVEPTYVVVPVPGLEVHIVVAEEMTT
ncbi:hypothetical protein NX059_007272 [Plenodomus lindquistii]|nr:hypothetical protein NX059_007272 [Plenodomus lindquistii]